MIGIDFRNFSVPISEEIILIYLAIIGLSYYLIFKKHHKRNEMKFSEIYPLVINYLVLVIISTFLLIFGIDTVFTGYIYNDEIIEVIKELTLGFLIISLVILNFIFYVKRHRVDLVQSEREAEEAKTTNIGEWIQIIIFTLMILVPLFNIFKYINFIDKAEKYRQIIASLLCIISSIFLLYNLNPLDIRQKAQDMIDKIKKKK